MSLVEYAAKNGIRNKVTLLTLHEPLRGAARRNARRRNIQLYAKSFAGDSALARAFQQAK